MRKSANWYRGKNEEIKEKKENTNVSKILMGKSKIELAYEKRKIGDFEEIK